MNIIWAVMVLGGFIVAALSGNMHTAASAALNGASDAVSLCITMVSVYALWLGVLKIAEKAGLVETLAKRLRGIIRFLFPGVSATSPAAGFITLNIVANVLGMGNAATPFGLKAIRELQESNPEKQRATNAMCMLLVINSSSIQLIPGTIVSLRNASGSGDASAIIIPTIITSAFAAFCGILAAKLLQGRSDG